MSIQNIGKSETNECAWCTGNMTLFQAAERIADFDVNALAVVGDDGSVLGIVSDHDIIRALVKTDGQLKDVLVEVYMSTPVVTCDEDTSLSNAMKLMGKHSIRHLVIIREGLFVRVLTIKDLLEKMHSNDEIEVNVLRELALGKLAQAM
ncbi:MAG: CBS domain-containing protein [Rhodobacteraceae bacterium]|nr:CBS domain-containing protein [Paracoccaceae bacterium]